MKMNESAVIYKQNESRFYARGLRGLDASLVPSRVVQTTLPELMSQYRQRAKSGTVRPNDIKPSITPDDLNQTQTKYVVIIEDGNKEAPTDYVFDSLFDLFSAARANNHVLILKGSLKCDFLEEYVRRRASLRFWHDDYDVVCRSLSDFTAWMNNSLECKVWKTGLTVNSITVLRQLESTVKEFPNCSQSLLAINYVISVRLGYGLAASRASARHNRGESYPPIIAFGLCPKQQGAGNPDSC